MKEPKGQILKKLSMYAKIILRLNRYNSVEL